jgi:hypothetical protein
VAQKFSREKIQRKKFSRKKLDTKFSSCAKKLVAKIRQRRKFSTKISCVPETFHHFPTTNKPDPYHQISVTNGPILVTSAGGFWNYSGGIIRVSFWCKLQQSLPF